MSTAKKHDSGASEGARRATEDAPESLASAGGGRWSAKRKVSVVLELLRGANLDSTSRKSARPARPVRHYAWAAWAPLSSRTILPTKTLASPKSMSVFSS